MAPKEHQFLIAAFDVDEHQTPRATPDRCVPVLSWRTVGVLCGLRGRECDEVVRRLAEAGHVSILDAGNRTLVLTGGRELIRGERDARRARIWRWTLWTAAAAGVGAGLLSSGR